MTTGICYFRVPFNADKTLDLPQSFKTAETSDVRLLASSDISCILQRYEEVLRQEMKDFSEMDRFAAVPEGKFSSLVIKKD